MKHPIDTSQWGEFKARDLFGPSKLGKYHNPKDLQASDDGYEYICATTMNNGINQTLSCVIGNNLTIPFKIGGGLSLTPSHIIAWGKQNPYFTYHENPCVTSQGMYFVEVTNKTRNQIHFLITVLNKLSSEFSYTNCLTGKIFDELSIPSPLKQGTNPTDYSQDDIDWDYMDTVMSCVTEKAKERLANLPAPEQRSKTPVDTSAWGEFVVGELFDKCDLKRIKADFNKHSDLSAAPTEEFNLPLINAKVGNNGIMYYGRSSDWESETMTLDIVNDGASSTGMVYAQPQATGTLYNAYQIKLKPSVHQNLTVAQLLFLATTTQASIQNKFSYENKAIWNKVQAESIKLPLKPSADLSNYSQYDIDWNYMDSFMQAIEEKAHGRVASLMKQTSDD